MALMLTVLLYLIVMRDVSVPVDQSIERSANVKQASGETRMIRIGKAEFLVEIADSVDEWVRGLSGRVMLAENTGMLFIFPHEEKKIFWNKDTIIPLDVIWLRNSEVVGVSYLFAIKTGEDPIRVYSPQPVNSVLEVNAGFVEKNSIKVGDRLTGAP